MPKLDRTLNHDVRSFDFVLKGTETLPLRKRTWSPGLPVLNQRDLGACTGFSAAMAAASMPGMTATNRKRLARNATAISLYIVATNLDAEPGQYPISDTGSDVNSALKGLRDLGWVGLYQWLPSARAVAGAVSHLGPVMMGTDWYESMMQTRPRNSVADHRRGPGPPDVHHEEQLGHGLGGERPGAHHVR